MSKKSKIFKSLSTVTSSSKLLKCIILIQVLLGRYFHLSQSKLHCFFIRLYCICFSLVISFFVVINYPLQPHSAVSFVFTEYICVVILSLFHTDNYFFNYCISIRTNDKIIGFKKIPLITNYLYATICIVVSVRLVLTVIRYYWFVSPNYFIFGYMITMLVCSDFSHIFIVMIFSILHVRMRTLRCFLENNDIPINIIGRNEVDISIKNIRKSLYYYNNLLDNMDIINQQVQYQVLIILISTVPLVIYLMSNIVTLILKGTYFKVMVMLVPEMIQILSALFYPAIIAEAIIFEVDKIRGILTKQLIRCSDPSLRFELETALQYVSLRPFKYTICRAVTLDIYLPFTIISLCITYVIVYMQLTNLSA